MCHLVFSFFIASFHSTSRERIEGLVINAMLLHIEFSYFKDWICFIRFDCVPVMGEVLNQTRRNSDAVQKHDLC